MNSKRPSTPAGQVSLNRALSKLGYCSRTQAVDLIVAGRVSINDKICRDQTYRVNPDRDRLTVDGNPISTASRIYLMLNKPRGLITSRQDEQQRPTIYSCLAEMDLPYIAPVGRLDKASEGLLLLTNDSRWAAQLTDPSSQIDKCYHVQIDRLADADFCQVLMRGVVGDQGEPLAVKTATVLRSGQRSSWLEITLDEGKNRHIRRIIEVLDAKVLRLVRVAVGPLKLGDLAKGAFRELTASEVASLKI